ncbi:high mobility group B protein 14 [Solanum verrucosum]|uniref:high mobility group B protein 14 n=1 Tax=Solanum verrucosum TaxID=315347 RepID=UPI0020D1E9AC|nr:high mobility group B protein 14 [Solanum verrucosum]
MAKKGSSKCGNSASTSTSTKSLRVKSAEKVKARGVKQSKPTSANKLSAISNKKPKKPPTAFFYFLEDFRKEFQEQNPGVRSMRDIGKACGEKWKIMTYEEKVHYYDIATEKRREFDRAMTYFNKKKEGGEFQEYEEDSDFDE